MVLLHALSCQLQLLNPPRPPALLPPLAPPPAATAAAVWPWQTYSRIKSVDLVFPPKPAVSAAAKDFIRKVRHRGAAAAVACRQVPSQLDPGAGPCWPRALAAFGLA
jgi:hypothetical protein